MKWYKQTDILLGVAVIAILTMLIVPIPTMLLDLLMSFSIMISIIILLTSLFGRKNTDFSTFPTLLLITTIFRLAINVSSTRMILLEGSSFDGQLVKAFGNFVVSGNYVVGFIIFLILVFVQMLVIAKGASRISEVTARFALDGLPGKQISIDSDLSAGLITEEEARSRRQQLEREIEFSGQMDGASKFIQGDVKVGLIITAINIIGGLIIGTLIHSESFAQSLKTYTLFSIGDGLISQIPSLLITTATGIVITRSGAQANLSEELSSQLFKNSKILWIVAISLFIAGLIPTFPAFPLFLIASFLAFSAYRLSPTALENEKKKQETDLEDKEKKSAQKDNFMDEWDIETIKVEIGFNLISLVDPEQGGQLIERITNLRKKFAKDVGMIIPPVRISDNMNLDSNEYSVLIGGIEISKVAVYPDKLVALNTGNVSEEMQGQVYKDPAYQIDGILIPLDKKEEAEKKGYTVADTNNIIITHLSEIFHNYATQIMGREEIKNLLDKIREKYPSIVDDSLKNLNYGGIQQLLHNLLKENVSIRNMALILDTVANFSDKVKDITVLTDLVRQKLGKQIIQQYLDEKTQALNVIQIDPKIEEIFRNSLTFDEHEGKVFNVNPHILLQIIDSLIQKVNNCYAKNSFPIFICSSQIRSGLVGMLERELSTRKFMVVAYEEVPKEIRIEMVDQVILEIKEETRSTSNALY